jgi:hypothetical protein
VRAVGESQQGRSIHLADESAPVGAVVAELYDAAGRVISVVDELDVADSHRHPLISA